MATLKELIQTVEGERYVLIHQKIRELYEAMSWGESKLSSVIPELDYLLEHLPKYREALDSEVKIETVEGYGVAILVDDGVLT